MLNHSSMHVSRAKLCKAPAHCVRNASIQGQLKLCMVRGISGASAIDPVVLQSSNPAAITGPEMVLCSPLRKHFAPHPAAMP